MRTVDLTILKNKLNEYIRLARDGEKVLIIDHGHVLAELGPPHADRAGTADALLAEATRMGWIRPAIVSTSAPPARSPVAKFDEVLRGFRPQ